MRILFIRQFNPYYENSASGNRFCGLIEGLRRCGNAVDIAVASGYKKKEEATQFEECVYYLSKANHYSYWQARLNTYIFNPLHERTAARRLKHLDLSCYDVLWLTNSSVVLNVFTDVKDRLKVKTLMELNEFNDFYLNANYNFLQARKAKRSSDLFKSVVGKIDMFAVMTNTLLDYYKKMANKDAKFMHLPMTVDLSRFNNIDNGFKYEKQYVGFCGSIDKSKDGVDILIKAFIEIASKYPEIDLLLSGFYTYDTPEIIKIVTDNKMEDRIKYLGPLGRDEIPSFISNACVLTLSRPDSHQAQGGFPTKLGEYLATGNPVCVTKVGEIPDYLEDNVSAFMATPGNIDSFADALDRALSDPENAKRVGMNGRKVAEQNFDAKLQAKRLADFLEENIKR